MLQDEEVQPNFLDKIFKSLSLDKFISKMLDGELRQLSIKKFLARLSLRERLDGLSPDERLDGLSPDERLEGLSPDEIKVYLQQIESKQLTTIK